MSEASGVERRTGTTLGELQQASASQLVEDIIAVLSPEAWDGDENRVSAAWSYATTLRYRLEAQERAVEALEAALDEAESELRDVDEALNEAGVRQIKDRTFGGAFPTRAGAIRVLAALRDAEREEG